jgi:hypothetical protein
LGFLEKYARWQIADGFTCLLHGANVFPSLINYLFRNPLK